MTPVENPSIPVDPDSLVKKYEYQIVDIDSIAPYAHNAKKHPQKHVRQIANSILRFGFINAILVCDGEILAGHGRYLAAKLVGLKKVPVIFVDNLDDPKATAYRLADNVLTLNTENDEGILKVEIDKLMGLELDFALEDIGLETAEIDILIDGDAPTESDPADDLPLIDPELPTITRRGDRWDMDGHRLICGDSRETETFKQLLTGETAHMCLTDPPFNVPVNGHVCGAGKVKHDEFAMASGEMSEEEFIAFLACIIALMIEFSRDGSLHYVFMDWRHIYELLKAGRDRYSELKNICIWNKTNGGMGSFYRSQHEMIAVFKNGTAPHLNTIELGKHGRYRTNVFDFAGANAFGGGQEDLKLHPTVKPVGLLVEMIKDCTRRGHIVLDPFSGSGSTLIACEKSGRQARCIEFEPKYCDVTIRRWQALTGKDAVNATTGKTFNETATRGDDRE